MAERLDVTGEWQRVSMRYAVVESIDTSGRAVVFAGITVVISLLGLTLIGLNFVTGIAVGSAVGQIAKIKGARAVGIAGGKDKCAYVKNELGFDDCLDHRDPDLAAKLALLHIVG